MDVFGPGAGKRFFRDLSLAAPVDQPEALRRVSDDDVVGNREIRDQRQLLEDADDARLVRYRRVGEPHLAAGERHCALVGLHHPGHDLDQRRFPGAVLAEDRVHPSTYDGEFRFFQRIDAAITLGDALHAEQRRGGFVHAAPRNECTAGIAPPRCSISSKPDYWLASVCPMISWAVKLMPQVGKSLPTKKLSDWSE